MLSEAGLLVVDRQDQPQAILAVFRLLQTQDKQIGEVLDNPKRSTALFQLVHMFSQDLLTEDEKHHTAQKSFWRLLWMKNGMTYEE